MSQKAIRHQLASWILRFYEIFAKIALSTRVERNCACAPQTVMSLCTLCFMLVLTVELGIVGLLMMSKRCVTATPLGSTPGESAQLPEVCLLMPEDSGVIQNIFQSPGVQTFVGSVSLASQVTPSAVQGSGWEST